MIQFFRKIRKRLLTENKFSSYLLYAFGEIFLVVLGILIALQINNWNENSKNEELQINYIKGLISDLDYDIGAFSQGIKEIEDHKKSGDALLRCYKFQTTPPDEELIEHLTNLGLISRVSHRNTVMDDMKSAGRLNIISSDSIRQRIIAYYKLASGTIESNEKNNEWILNHIIGSRIYTEYVDFNSAAATTQKIPEMMKSIEVNEFSGLPFIQEIEHPDRDNVINLITAKNWLEGLNKLYGLNARAEALALKQTLEEYLKQIDD